LRVPSYRTTWGLAGLVMVFIAYSLRNLRAVGRISRNLHYVALGSLLAFGAVGANRHAYSLIAEPQGFEWQIMLDAALRMPLESDLKIYVIRPSIDDRATQRIFADEFGSLSSDTDWAVVEMFKCALRRRFPSGLPEGVAYTLTSGQEAPREGKFDIVIDMRELRKHRLD